MRTSRYILFVLFLSLISSQQISAETLLEAARAGNVERVQQWLAQGEDVNARHHSGYDPFNWGSTLLHAAVSSPIRDQIQGHDLIHIAFALSKDSRIEIAPFSGYTPALSGSDKRYQTLARQLRHQLALVSLLLAHGADVSLATAFGGQRTPLHIAALAGNLDIVELLLAQGADVNARLRSSHYFGSDDLISWGICERSEEPTVRYQKGRTPLHLAMCKPHLTMAELLLAHGADVNAQDSVGHTPLHLAALYPNPAIAAFLLEYNAQVDIGDEAGKTPLQIAREYRNKETAQLLVTYRPE